jgi:TRAP-type mannitol/chloroaromatic compound transport system permease small subunit
MTSWDFTANSWLIREGSVEPGGLPFVYLLKSLLPLMAINLALQGVAELLRNAMTLIGTERDVHAD